MSNGIDTVKRLRDFTEDGLYHEADKRLLCDAADEIERLRGAQEVPLAHSVTTSWWVVTPNDGIAFSIDAHEFDARARAEHWVHVMENSHLERVTHEHWTGSRRVSREVVLPEPER